MKADALDTLIDCQAALIAALDGGDVSAIEQATSALAVAVGNAQGRGAWRAQNQYRDKIEYGLKQSKAASIRVNCLSHSTRQRIVRLTDLRGGNFLTHYNISKKYT